MPLSGHEAFELNELLMSCFNSITCMGVFSNQTKDPELKGLIQKHMAAHIQDYNIKVDWATKQSTTQKLNVPQLAGPTQSGAATTQPVAVTPDPNATAFDDRAIATSYLLTLKRAGREYAWATMEASQMELRSFLMDAFTMAANHAYEVSQWMAKKGYYPGETASSAYLQKLAQTYQPVKEMAAVH